VLAYLAILWAGLWVCEKGVGLILHNEFKLTIPTENTILVVNPILDDVGNGLDMFYFLYFLQLSSSLVKKFCTAESMFGLVEFEHGYRNSIKVKVSLPRTEYKGCPRNNA
jgi:hypothetical protein